MRPLLCALAGLALVAGAQAKDSDWKAFRKAYDDTQKLLEDDPGHVQLLAELQGHVDKMLAVDAKKTVKFLFEEELYKRPTGQGQVVVKALGQITDERVLDDVAKLTEKAAPSSQSLLFPVLAKHPTGRALRVLLKGVKDKEPLVRRAAIRALGSAGPAVLESAEGPLKSALRSKERREQWLAAAALEAITGARPEGYPVAELDADTSFPQGWPVDRVLFVVEWSPRAAQAAFSSPFTAAAEEGEEQEAPKDDAPKAPELHSPLDLAAAQIARAIAALPKEVEYRVVRYGDRPRTFSDEYERGGDAKVADEVRAWLTEDPSRGPRNLAKALEWIYQEEVAPDLVVVFTTGLPSGPRVDVDSTLETARYWAWGRDLVLNVVGLWPTPAKEPDTEVGKEELALEEGNFRRMVHGLAQIGGGEFRMHQLTRPAAAAPEEPKQDFPVDFPLDEPLSSSQVAQLKRALRGVEGSMAELLWNNTAACPDLQAARLAVETLTGEDLTLATAALNGFARNKEPKVLGELEKELEKARDPRERMRLLRALGLNPDPASAEALVKALSKLEGDALRVAWRLLALKPEGDLAPHADAIVKAARGLRAGLTYHHAIRAVAKANGKPAPPTGGLDVAPARLLPERFAGGGVAILIDTYRDVNEPFWTPPPPAPAPEDGGKGKGKGKEPAKPAPEPVTRREAMRREVGHALDALFAGEQSVYLGDLGGKTFGSGATHLERRNVVEDARTGWTICASTPPGTAQAVRDALADPAVGEVYVLATGTPLRSPGAEGPEALAEDLAQVLDLRQVAVHVILPLGTKQEDTAEYRDYLAALDKVYRPLAELSGGSVELRHALKGVPE
ncbi:MAG: hypothetical protein R3F62_01665 [Planctomycetota bacterium]